MNEQVTVKTISMYPRQWDIVDGVAAALGLNRSLAVRHIVEVYKSAAKPALATLPKEEAKQ